MSKVMPRPGPTVPYAPTEYVTARQITAHFGTDYDALPEPQRPRFDNYATEANRQVEAALYKYVDRLPLAPNDEALAYAKSMAMHYALWLKQIDDGSENAAQREKAWMGFRQSLVETLKAQPKLVTTRRIVSNGYADELTPYSQSYGLSDIL